jgi:actin-related protein
MDEEYESERQERIEFFDEIEDCLMAIRQQIRYKFPNFNILPELDAMMQNMIKTNQLLSQVQDWVRE